MLRIKIFLIASLIGVSALPIYARAQEQLNFSDYLSKRQKELSTDAQIFEAQWLSYSPFVKEAIERTQKKSMQLMSMKFFLPLLMSLPFGAVYFFHPHSFASLDFSQALNEVLLFMQKSGAPISRAFFPELVRIGERWFEGVQLVGGLTVAMGAVCFIFGVLNDWDDSFRVDIGDFNDFYKDEIKIVLVLNEKFKMGHKVNLQQIEAEIAQLILSIDKTSKSIERFSDVEFSMRSVKRMFRIGGPWDMSKASNVLRDAQAQLARDFMQLQVFKLQVKVLMQVQKEWKNSLTCADNLSGLVH